MKNNASLIYGLVLVVGDFLALVSAFVFAYILRVSLSDRPIAQQVHAITYFKIFLVLLPFWILIFALFGLYSNSVQENRFKEVGRLLIGSFIGLLFVISYAYFDKRPVFPAHLVPVYGFSLAFVFLVVFRNLAREARASLFKFDIGLTNVLIIGNTKVAQELVGSLANRHISGYRIVGVVGSKAHTAERFPHIPVFDSFEDAIKKIKVGDIHSIVQTELYASQDKNNQVLEFAQTNHIAYRFIPGNTEMFFGNIEVELFRSQIPVISVHQTALLGWGQVVKRIFDLLIGGVFFVVTLPIMIVIALFNLIFTGGVFFRQTRLTRFNETFKVYKFQTVKNDYNGPPPINQS